MNEKMTGTIMGAVVALIMVVIATNLIAGIVVGETKTMVNDGGILTVSEIGSDDDWELSVSADGNTVTMNGSPVEFSKLYWLSNDVFVYADATTIHIIEYVDSASVSTATKGTNAFTLTATNGTVTVSVDSTVKATTTYDWAYVYDAEGDYIYSTASVTPTRYVNGVENITAFSAGNKYVYHNGISYVAGVETEDVNYNWNLEDTSSSDLFTLTLQGTTAQAGEEAAAALGLCIVHINVDYHVDNGITSMERTLFNIVPVLFLAALVIGIVANVAYKRNGQ